MIVAQAVSNYLMARDAVHEERERSGCFNPSSFGRCLRLQTFNRRNEPKTEEREWSSLLNMEAGSQMHSLLQVMIKQEHPEAVIEAPVNTQPDVLGYADVVDEESVIDLKTISQYEMKMIDNSSTDIANKKKTNWLQVMFYAIELGKPKARLAFYDKNRKIAEWELPVDDYWKTEVANELKTLREYWEKGELPPAGPRAFLDKDGNSNDCKYCSWKAKCDEMEKSNEPK